ncbi:chemotaxis protein CheA [Yoonia sp. BS5-3]|uniref:Chemotaxis protein CheA n=1 Tax=Yoonia phaeophyticola TaxID=3137369 RepID=A0ABZ2V263_9RHOB
MGESDDIRAMFFEECNDLMEALFEGLKLLEDNTPEPDTVNAVFRAVHSIKGGAGAFKLDDLVSFAHKFETVLDELRADRLSRDDALVQTMLRAADHLAHLVEVSQFDGEINSERGEALLEELDFYVAGEEDEEEVAFEPMTLNFGGIDIEAPSKPTVSVRFQPFEKLYFNGHDPLLLIDALGSQGELSIEIDLDALPALDEYASETPTLTFLLTFTADDPETVVDEVFEFVDGICRLEVVRNDGDDGGDGGSSLEADLSPEPPEQDEPAQANPTEIEQGSKVAAEPSTKAKNIVRNDAVAVQPTLRVELDKVDRLINTVGELIINQAMIAQRIDMLNLPGDGDLESDMADYKLLARELQEGVMSIRAQPVKSLFQRMARITREAGDATGKSVRFVTHGENTEVDKTVIERLADPLTHMIRNAVDHGLEDREGRLAAGKPETGQISLSASHKSGNVMIEVVDDGAGLNRDRILDIAINKGLVSRDSDLTDPEIDMLLFLPGFSTNDEVSELSGRGVGMDVVKTAVQALGGRISINSTPGNGTKFSIVLPLTLAVMDGIVISVAGETMIVPITAVVETLRPKESEVFRMGVDQDLLMIRGEYVPIVDVRKKLGLADSQDQQEQLVLVLVESVDHSRCALCVDAIHDQRQVVIKAVGGNYGEIPGVSAATILGNGRIALILDTDHLTKVETISPPLPSNSKQDVKVAHA